MMKNDDRLIENIRQVLEQSLDGLDAATESRLARARHLAMERRQDRKPISWYWGSIPAAGLLALLLFFNWSNVPTQPVATPDLGELSILTAAEPLEFYQEEIEFYEWLAEVLEAEKELSEYSAPQSAPVAEPVAGSRTECTVTAEHRTSRFSGVI